MPALDLGNSCGDVRLNVEILTFNVRGELIISLPRCHLDAGSSDVEGLLPFNEPAPSRLVMPLQVPVALFHFPRGLFHFFEDDGVDTFHGLGVRLVLRHFCFEIKL